MRVPVAEETGPYRRPAIGLLQANDAVVELHRSLEATNEKVGVSQPSGPEAPHANRRTGCRAHRTLLVSQQPICMGNRLTPRPCSDHQLQVIARQCQRLVLEELPPQLV